MITPYPALFLAMVAIILGIIAWRGEGIHEAIRLGAALACAVMLVVAGFMMADWIAQEFAARRADFRRSEVAGRVMVLDRMITILSHPPDQITAVLDRLVPTVEIVAGDSGPLELLRVGHDKLVSRALIERYINLGTVAEMYPLRELYRQGIGNSARDELSAFVDYAVSMGWARPAAGNQPSMWIDYSACIKAIWG